MSIQSNIYFADFETTYDSELDKILTNEEIEVGEYESKVFLVGVINTNGEYNQLYTVAELLDFLQGRHVKKTRVWCGFHNLTFDGSFILSYILELGFKQSLDIFRAKPVLKEKEFHIMGTNNKIIRLTVNGKGTYIVFFDTLKLIPVSLDAIGKITGVPKLTGEVNYKEFQEREDRKYPQMWLEYLKRDCEVLKSAFVGENRMWNITDIQKVSLGAISGSYVKGCVQEVNEDFRCRDFDVFNNWYRGGYCDGKRSIQGKWYNGRIKHIDACSMYPSRMVEPLPQTIQNSENAKILFLEISISKAKILPKYEDYPILPKPHFGDGEKKKFKIPKEFQNEPYHYIKEFVNFEGYPYFFVQEEGEEIQKRYSLVFEIKTVVPFSATTYLKGEIDELFLDKKKAKEEGNKVKEFIAKRVINSISGKFGQNPYMTTVYYTDDISTLPSDGEVESECAIRTSMHKKKCYNIRKKPRDEAKARPVFVIAYITAMSRVNLFRKQRELLSKGCIPLYSDTDSIIYDDVNGDTKLDKMGNNLGEWSYEELKYKSEKFNHGDSFKWLCPKHYRIAKNDIDYPIKSACAGVRVDTMLAVKNEDYNYDLVLTKMTALLGKYGRFIKDTEYNFRKWKNIIK